MKAGAQEAIAAWGTRGERKSKIGWCAINFCQFGRNILNAQLVLTTMSDTVDSTCLGTAHASGRAEVK